MPSVAQDKSVTVSKFKNRVALIDNVKGLLVIIFLLSQMLIQIEARAVVDLGAAINLPGWFEHGADVSNIPFWNFFGFSFLDMGPISFFFVIGIVVFWAFEKKRPYEKPSASLKKFLGRNATIVGIFLPLNIIASMFLVKSGGLSSSWNWGTIASIGFTGLLLTPFMAVGPLRRRWWIKVIAGLGVLALYYYCYDFFKAFDGTEGGPMACVGFTAVVLFVGAIGDLQRKKLGVLWYTLITAALLLFGAYIKRVGVWGPAVYDDYNATYLIMALNLVNLVYYVFFILDKLFLKGRAIPILATLGRNILLFFILTGCVINAFIGILPVFAEATPTTLYAMQIGSLLLYLVLAIILEKKKIVFKL
ncbi:MAG: hypothetical protein LBP79_05605 [Clostridiales bacterium]|jgi:hypothetical protein|nr:hypothetical protein [Clostridiales bacterium]